MLAASKQIAEAATSEIERRRSRKQQVPRTISRRWKILEIFTWSCSLHTAWGGSFCHCLAEI